MIGELPGSSKESIAYSSSMYRLMHEGVRTQPGVGYVHPTRKDLADLIYPGRPNGQALLSKLAGRIGAELDNPNLNPSIHKKLSAILSASELAGSPAIGVAGMLRRNIPYEEAQRMAQRARRRGAHYFRDNPRPLHRSSEDRMEFRDILRDILAEEMLKVAQARGVTSPHVLSDAETSKDPRTLDDGHIYRLLDFFSHMTAESMDNYGLRIPQVGQTRMLEVMARMRSANPNIVEKVINSLPSLKDKLADFPVDKSWESSVKRESFLSANKNVVAKNILGVLQTVDPKKYDELLSELTTEGFAGDAVPV